MAGMVLRLTPALWLALLSSISPAVCDKPKLYFYAQGNLRNPPFLEKLTGLMDIARGCGYDGMFYSDEDIQTMHLPGHSNATFRQSLSAMQRHAQNIGLELAPLIFPFGPSDAIFQQPPWRHNLAEPLAFRGALFEVDASRTSLRHIDEFRGLNNGDFSRHSGDSFEGWVQDAPGSRTTVATTGCHSPGACLQINPGPGDGLAMQPLDVRPFAQLHVSFFARTSGFRAVQCNVEVRALLPAAVGDSGVRPRMGRRLSWWSLNVQPTQPWQRAEYISSSWDGSSPVALFVGIEERGNASQTQQGMVWFDDISVTTTALVNVIRRAGAPLRLYDPSTGEAFVEGRDVEPIVDPLVYKDGHFDSFHAAPSVRVLAEGNRLEPRQRLRMDYYAVNPIFGSDVASCLLHEGIFAYMRQSTQAVANDFDWAGFLMSYDEIRQLHNDADETASFDSAGALLAWHARNATRTVRGIMPGARLYVWDDMFNPFHNAASRGTPSDGYFLANGSMQGAWEGLEAGKVTVLNWGPCDEASEPDCRYRSGLQFFAGRGLQQMVGGFYDYALCEGCPKNATAAAEREFRFVHDISGIEGYSYTTWGSNNEDGQPHYEQMCDYARTLRRLHEEEKAAGKVFV